MSDYEERRKSFFAVLEARAKDERAAKIRKEMFDEAIPDPKVGEVWLEDGNPFKLCHIVNVQKGPRGEVFVEYYPGEWSPMPQAKDSCRASDFKMKYVRRDKW